MTDTRDVVEIYEEIRDTYQGWCTTCEEVTRDCTEPDAQDYDCPVCEENTVIGADLFLMEAV